MGSMLGLVGTMLGFGIGAIVILCLLLIVYIRVYSKDKIIVIYHRNKRRGGVLLPYDASENCVWLGREDDPKREKYTFTEDEIEMASWPGGLPSFFTVDIRSIDCVKGFPSAINMAKVKSGHVSAKSLRLLSDGKVLEAVYLHARQGLGLAGAKTSMMTLIILMVIMAASLYAAYTGMQNSGSIGSLQSQIGSIQQTLGVRSVPAPVAPVVPVPQPTVKTTPTPTSPVPLPVPDEIPEENHA